MPGALTVKSSHVAISEYGRHSAGYKHGSSVEGCCRSKLHVFSEVLFWSIAVFGSMIMSFHHGPAGLVQSHLVFRLTTETV